MEKGMVPYNKHIYLLVLEKTQQHAPELITAFLDKGGVVALGTWLVDAAANSGNASDLFHSLAHIFIFIYVNMCNTCVFIDV